MTQIIFYEKPGCINNTKQKKWLVAAGHEVIAKNILETEWRPDELVLYFGEKPVAEWFNRMAPRVKSGEVVPESFSSQEALELMVKEPILIKRPLLRVGEERAQGFHADAVHAWVSLDAAEGNESFVDELKKDDLTTCPMLEKNTNCDEQLSKIPERPLALVMEITEAVGFEVTYEYDDLVFVSHNVFLFRFAEAHRDVDIFFNTDCEEDAERRLMGELHAAAENRGIVLTKRGHYRLSEADGENISIEFIA